MASSELEGAMKVWLLSEDRSGDAPMMRRGPGGSYCDGGTGYALPGDRASTVVAQFDDEETRPKTLDEGLRRS